MLFREIFQDQNGGWFFGPAFLKGVWNLPLRHVECAENKVDILIAVIITGVQCNPSPAVGFRQCVGGKIAGPAPPLAQAVAPRVHPNRWIVLWESPAWPSLGSLRAVSTQPSSRLRSQK